MILVILKSTMSMKRFIKRAECVFGKGKGLTNALPTTLKSDQDAPVEVKLCVNGLGLPALKSKSPTTLERPLPMVPYLVSEADLGSDDDLENEVDLDHDSDDGYILIDMGEAPWNSRDM